MHKLWTLESSHMEMRAHSTPNALFVYSFIYWYIYSYIIISCVMQSLHFWATSAGIFDAGMSAIMLHTLDCLNVANIFQSGPISAHQYNYTHQVWLGITGFPGNICLSKPQIWVI